MSHRLEHLNPEQFAAVTAREITARIDAEVSKALAEPALKERYAKLWLGPVGGRRRIYSDSTVRTMRSTDG